MGRMSEEEYRRAIEYVDSAGDKSYRVPPDMFEMPWKYLSTGEKIAVCFWKGVYYNVILLAIGFCISIGTCSYSEIKRLFIEEKKSQPKTSMSRTYDDRIQDYRFISGLIRVGNGEQKKREGGGAFVRSVEDGNLEERVEINLEK